MPAVKPTRDTKDDARAQFERLRVTHEWIAVGARRWCLACGSYQVRRNGAWRDDMVGPWPGYNPTDTAAHMVKGNGSVFATARGYQE